MEPKRLARLDKRAKVLKAMAHPVRLLILETLQKGEQCVCALTDLAALDMSTVSRHLLQLENAGILAKEKRANQVFYRLRCPCALKFFDCVDEVLAVKGVAKRR